MASSISALAQQSSWRLLPAIARLTGWRFKQTWRFLLVTWLGMLVVVVLVCILPLFSRVAITADLRSEATNGPDGQNILVQVDSLAPNTSQLQQIAQQLDRMLRQGSFGVYLQSAPRLVVRTPDLVVLSSGRTTASAIFLDAYDPIQAAQHATVVQGRLPRETTDGSVEIALAQSVTSNLGLHVGSTIQGRYPASFNDQAWTLHVVGIIAPRAMHDPFWTTVTDPFGSQSSPDTGPTAYSVLAPLETVRAKIATMQATSGGSDPSTNAFHLFWSYPFNVALLDANNVITLSQEVNDLPLPIGTTLSHIQGVSFAFPFGSLFGTLSTYAQSIVVLQIVITFLLLLTLAIILFLIGMLSDMLVERQAEVIATLRSRGASRRHVFGTFVAQGLVLGLLALLIGPLLALLLVHTMAQALLTPDNQQALNVINANPIQAALDVKWYALVAIAVALLVMVVAIGRAAKLDIVGLRRESSRTQHVPLWRRLNLDLLLVLLIVVGYIAYIYLWQSLVAGQAFDPLLYNLLKAGGFIAPPLLVAVAFMLLLRFFPRILHLATSLATKRRSAPAMLALAQVERAPRPAARVVVLLALAIAASCFLLTLVATKQARTSDAATFAVGADFSSPLPVTDSTKTFDQLRAEYGKMPGVQSATLGYYNDIDQGNAGDIHIEATDADTYAHTALWPAQNSSQSLATLTAQLVTHRADASTQQTVYALVDAALWQQLHLSPGASFTLPVTNDTPPLRIQFIALTQINYIPGIYDTPIDTSNGVGLLVDYQSYATVYAKESGMALSPNAVLLRTWNDGSASALAHIRTMLPGLQDRRQLTIDNQENSVHLDIIGVLTIGVAAALMLALVGTLLASALNASNRRTNFAVLRALGMAPRQVAAMLLWEQGFVYLLTFLMGIGLGALLTIFVPPVVSLLDLSGTSSEYNPYDVPPMQAVIPYGQLALLLGGLAIVCLVALLLMARIVSRPSISQTLRLNED